MTAMTNYLEDKLIGHVFMGVAYTMPSGLYVSLFTTQPTDLGTDGVEVVGGSYARQSAPPGGGTPGWAQTAGGAGKASNTQLLTFTNMPACTVVGTGIWDALTGGNLLTHGTAAAPRTVVVGDSLTIAVNGLNVTFA